MKLLSLILVAACSRSSIAPIPASNASTDPSSMSRPEGERGKMKSPSAPGASIELVLTDGGVDLVFTADDPDVREQIVAIAEQRPGMRISELQSEPTSSGCPIVRDATTVTATRTDDGVIVHILALVPEEVEALQEETRARVAGLSAHEDAAEEAARMVGEDRNALSARHDR